MSATITRQSSMELIMKLKNEPTSAAGAPKVRMAEAFGDVEEWLETHLSAKGRQHLLATAGPLLLCLTFIDDGLRIPLRWGEQHDYMTQFMGMWSWIATAVLAASSLTQLAATWLVLRPASHVPSRAKLGCYMLLAFVVLQPLLYGQCGDLEFMGRSSTVAGGLLLMIWGENDKAGRRKDAISFGLLVHDRAGERSADTLQVAGRLLLASMFLVEAVLGKQGGLHSVLDAPTLWNVGASCALLALSLMVCLGFKAEWSSLVLGAVLGVTNVCLYPFWSASVPEALKDVYRFYFFQTLSIMGGLMLLTLHGPGGLSLDGQKKLR